MKQIIVLAVCGVAAYLLVKRFGGDSYSAGLTVNNGRTAVPDDFGNYDSTRGFLDNPSGDTSADAQGATT